MCRRRRDALRVMRRKYVKGGVVRAFDVQR